MNNIKENFYDIIKKKDHNLIKKLLLDEIDKHIEIEKNIKNNNKEDLYIMAVNFNCRKDKTKYFSFSIKEELIKKIVYYMYDDIKKILFYDWNENFSIMQNLDKILLENDCLSVSLELITIN